MGQTVGLKVLKYSCCTNIDFKKIKKETKLSNGNICTFSTVSRKLASLLGVSDNYKRQIVIIIITYTYNALNDYYKREPKFALVICALKRAHVFVPGAFKCRSISVHGAINQNKL